MTKGQTVAWPNANGKRLYKPLDAMAHGLAAIPHHYGDYKQTFEKHIGVLRWSKHSLFVVLRRHCCNTDYNTFTAIVQRTVNIHRPRRQPQIERLDVRATVYFLHVMPIFTITTKPDLSLVVLRADMKEYSLSLQPLPIPNLVQIR